MTYSKAPTIVITALLLTLFAPPANCAQPQNTLSGRDLLRVMRDKEGRGPIPAYEKRLEKTKSQEEPAAPEAPEISEKPVAPVVSHISTTPLTKPAGDELLQMIPAGSMFCLRVNNFDYTLNQIDQFLAGLSPVPMGVSILARTQLATLLGSPELDGVQMGGDFAMFGPLLNSELTDPDNIGLLVPITDYKQFISGNPNVSEPDERGVSRIISDGIPPMLVTEAKSYALISPQGNDNELIATAKAISASAAPALPTVLDADDVKQAVEQPIWAYGNVQLASRTFGPILFGKIEEMKMMMQSTNAGGIAPAADPSAIINVHAGILETLMKQTRFVSIALNPGPDALRITKTISAMPGTDMANMFLTDASAAQENKLLAYLQDGAAMNFACKMNTPFWKKLNIKSADFYAAIGGESISAEDTAKMKRLTEDAIASLGGPAVFSFLTDAKSRPPFAFKYILEVQNADKLNNIIEEAVAMMNTGPITDFHKNLGMELTCTLKRKVDSYKGVSIDSARLLMKPTDPNSPQAQAIAMVFTEGFDYKWAMINGLCVCAAGGDVDSTIRELIDQAKADFPMQMPAEIKNAAALLPEAGKADFLVTFNYLRLFKMLTALMPIPLPEIDVPTKSNFALAGKATGGKMTINVALPKEHLNEIMAVFQMMQQQRMTMQPQDDKSLVTKTKVNLTILHNAVNEFKMDTGRFPTEEEGLYPLIEQPGDVTNYPPGGYLQTMDVLRDAWGNDFVYELYPESGKPFVIISYGADGKAGGTGDDADLRTDAN